VATSCITIDREEIRAEVYLGGTLLATTPFVKNFNVNMGRSQFSTTFSVTMELLAGTVFPIGANLSIAAGTRGNLNTVFTGLIESTTAQPSFGKPSYFLVTLSGQGVLSNLKDKKFSRRLRSAGQGLYCLITGGGQNRPQSYWSLDKRVVAGNQTMVRNSPNLARREGENSPLAISDGSGNQAIGGRPEEIAGQPSGGEGGTGEFRTHTHENMDEGGPAFAVYSPD
jgi:hypothetical protein